MSVMKNSLKELTESNRLTTSLSKNSSINSMNKSVNNKENLLKEKEEKEKLNKYLENEKEMVIRKTQYLKQESSRNLSLNKNESTKSNEVSFEMNKNPQEITKNLKTSSSHTNLVKPQAVKPVFSQNKYREDEEEKGKINLNDDKFNQYSECNFFNKVNDFNAEEDKLRDSLTVDQNRVDFSKNMLKDLNSEYEYKDGDELSDCTSMTSTNSFKSQFDKNDIPVIPERSLQDKLHDAKKLVSNFYQRVLKIKFEKLHSSHKGQAIENAVLFKECIKKNIPETEWDAFILKELNNPSKYVDSSKQLNKKMKIHKKSGYFFNLVFI